MDWWGKGWSGAALVGSGPGTGEVVARRGRGGRQQRATRGRRRAGGIRLRSVGRLQWTSGKRVDRRHRGHWHRGVQVGRRFRSVGAPARPDGAGGRAAARGRPGCRSSRRRRGGWSASDAAEAANPHADDRTGHEVGSGDVEAKMMNVHVTLPSWRQVLAGSVSSISGPVSNEFRPSLELPSLRGRHEPQPSPEVIAS
jgi:hypothetical protein